MRLAHSLLQQQGAVGGPGGVTGLSGYRWQFQVLQVPPLQTPDESMTVLTSPVLQG
jgi:hypothetical protein